MDTYLNVLILVILILLSGFFSAAEAALSAYRSNYLEKLDEETQYILEIAAIMHDIGIKISEEKYNSSAGNYQEIEGPPVARKMLEGLDFDEKIIDRVCFLIGHHHTYSKIDNIDYQILVEADFLVNIYEDEIKHDSIVSIKNKYFKTKAGTNFLEKLYLS